MNRFTTLLSAIIVAATATAQTANNINLGWQFALNNDTANVPTSWQNVDLPHDWSILKPPFQSAPSGNENGYFETGVAWYKQNLMPFCIKQTECAPAAAPTSSTRPRAESTATRSISGISL